MNPKRCFKTNVAGVTLYLSWDDSKLIHTKKTLVEVSDLVKVEAPGFSNAHIPALELAEEILDYDSGADAIELSLCGRSPGSKEPHPFLPDKYVSNCECFGVAPSWLQIVDYTLPTAEAKRLADEYLQSMKSRNPQDPC